MKKMIKKWGNIPIKEKVFQIINVALVLAIVCFYFYRMVYWQKKLIKETSEKYNDTLFSLVTDLSNVDLSSDDRLYANEDGTYVFKGNCQNNYVLYSNQLYRIISIDESSSVKIISQDALCNSVLYETEGFLTSGLYSWLNGDDSIKGSGFYEKTLKNRSAFTTTVKTDYAVISDLNHINSTFADSKATLLSVMDYANAGGKDSYLNNGIDFWLSNINDNGRYFFVSSSGDVAVSYSDSLMLAVRPVINLNYTVAVIEGNGTIDAPYVINASEHDKVSSLESGSYVSYSEYLWRIQYIDDNDNAIITLNDTIKKDGAEYLMPFGQENEYNTSNGIGKYLNSTFIKTLNDYDKYLVENDWDFGQYNVADHNYLCNYQGTIKAYVALPHAGYLYLDRMNNIFFMTSSLNSRKTVYVFKDHLLYESTNDQQSAVVCAVCVNKDVLITSGSGSATDPYKLGLAE